MLTINLSQEEMKALDRFREEHGEPLSREQAAHLLLTDQLKGIGVLDVEPDEE